MFKSKRFYTIIFYIYLGYLAVFRDYLPDVTCFAHHHELQIIFWEIAGDNLFRFFRCQFINILLKIIDKRFVKAVPEHLRQQIG